MELKSREDICGTKVFLACLRNMFGHIKDLELRYQCKTPNVIKTDPATISMTAEQLYVLSAGLAFSFNLSLPELIDHTKEIESVFYSLVLQIYIFLSEKYCPEEISEEQALFVKKELADLSKMSAFKNTFFDYSERVGLELSHKDILSLHILEFVYIHMLGILELFQGYKGDNAEQIFKEIYQYIPKAKIEYVKPKMN